MTRPYIVGALMVVVACAPSTLPVFDTATETAKWVQLWRTYDLDLVDDLFVTDSTVTYLSSEREGLILGFDSVRVHHEGFGFVPGGVPPASELLLEDVHSELRGDATTVTAVWFFGDRAAPRDSVQHGPVTFVYVWREDGWRVAHVQFGNYE
jgi:hypothetical protein